MIMSKKIQKYFLLIIFLLSQKMKHFKYFLILFKDLFFQTFKTQIFSKLLVNILHFSKSFSKHFNKLTHLFPWSTWFEDKTEPVFSPRISELIMGLPHGVSPNPFYVHIKFSLYIFNHLCKYPSINKLHSFVFIRLFIHQIHWY